MASLVKAAARRPQPLCPFLYPPPLRIRNLPPTSRYLSTFPSHLAAVESPKPTEPPPQDPPTPQPPTLTPSASENRPLQPLPLTPSETAYLSSALRINHAGELAATRIYSAQTPLLTGAYPHLLPLLSHMHAQEAGHLRTFNILLRKHRVRPTAMMPLWRVASSALGWITAKMGKEAAMACTEAVETEIGGHYNDQVRGILGMIQTRECRGETVEMEGSVLGELKGLLETVRRIRDEELEHLDEAVEGGAKEAKPYEALTGVIRWGCRGAIKISERI